MNRAVLSCLLALGLTGCRTSEPLTGARASSEQPVAEGAEPAGAGDGEAAGGAVAGETEDASDGSLGEATVDAGEPADAQPIAGEPAGVDATAAAAGPASPTAAPRPTTKRARIKAFFASDPDEALSKPRYTARKVPEPPGQVEALLDVRPLLGQSVLASPDPDAEVIATLTPKGLATATDACMWVIFQQEIPWTKGKLRCGDVFLRQRHGAEGTEEMLPTFGLFKDDTGDLWFLIIATNDGRTGWVRMIDWFQPFHDVLAEYSAGGSRTWDRVLYSEPGGSPVKIKFRGAIALQVHEALVDVDGRRWLRVEARVDQCIEGSRRKLGEGWIPQHAEDGSLNVYYELSC